MKNIRAAFLTIFLIIFCLYLIKVFDISYPITIVSTSKTSELSVVGEGKVDVVPDTAYINLGIKAEGKTVKEVQTKISQVNNSLIEGLKKLGIKKEDIKTINYSIYPNYDYSEKEQKITNYSGGADLRVKIKNFDLVGKVIDEATKIGANQVGGVNFEIEEMDKYRERAREAAIKNAKAQAEKIAKTLGIKLGRITNIVESTPQSPMPYLTSMKERFLGGETPQIEPGTQTITSVVTLYFEKR